MMMFCRVFALVSAVLFVAACDGSFGPFEPVDIAVESSFAEADGPVAVAGEYAAVVGTVGTQRVVDVYVRKVSGWQKLQRLSARSPKRVDPWDFGNAVSMVGRYLAVSGRSNKGGPEGHGYADIYERTDGVYVFQRSVTATESHVYPTDHPTFGDRLACFGQRLLVGVRRDLGYRGRAYLFNLSTGAREAEFNVPAIDPLAAYNQFGSAVALSSDRVVIGQDYEYATCPRTPCPSPVYVFRRDSSGEWPLERQIYNPYTIDHPSFLFVDHFGSSLAIVKDWLAIGARNPGGPGGRPEANPRVNFFHVAAGTWSFDSSAPAPGVEPGFGIDDGDEFAVGDTGGELDGAPVGRVRLFAHTLLASDTGDDASVAVDDQLILPSIYAPYVALSGGNLVVSTNEPGWGALFFGAD